MKKTIIFTMDFTFLSNCAILITTHGEKGWDMLQSGVSSYVAGMLSTDSFFYLEKRGGI